MAIYITVAVLPAIESKEATNCCTIYNDLGSDTYILDYANLFNQKNCKITIPVKELG